MKTTSIGSKRNHSNRSQHSVPGFRAGVRDTRGQSLVELALTVPLFLLILVGAMAIARFAWASIEATNAARAGVQYAAQSHTTASDAPGIGNAIAYDSASLSGLTWTSNLSCACANGTTKTPIACGSTALTNCPSPSTILEYVQVNTTAAVAPLFRFPGLPTTFTAQGQATMEVAP